MVRSVWCAAFIVIATGITGCSQEPPKCSDEATLTLVRDLLKVPGATERELADNMKFAYAHATAFDKSIKKYSCEANLAVGGSQEVNVHYESQLDDKDEHLVSVQGLREADSMQITLALTEAIQKGRPQLATGNADPASAPTATPTPTPIAGAAASGTMLQVSGSVPDVPVPLPAFAPNEPYNSVRQKMIAVGWQPFHTSSALECDEGDKRCQGRPEMEACSGSGEANCRFTWSKGSNMTGICTTGEDAGFSNVCPQ